MPAVTGPTKTLHFRNFSKGMNQTSARPALDDKEVYWLENVQPIGPGQLKILPPPASGNATIAVGIASLWGINMKIAGVETERLITVNSDGSMSAVTRAGAVTQIASPNVVTTSARLTTWQDTPVLIGDPTKGYFSWDGTTLLSYPVSLMGTTNGTTVVTGITPNTTGLASGMSIVSTDFSAGTTIVSANPTTVTISVAATGSHAGLAMTVGAGAPTGVTDLAAFEQRACLVTGTRAITLTAPASYTDFQTADGSYTYTITDSVFAGSIKRILSALEVLWVIGPSAVNAISNIQIVSGQTTLSNTNIVSNVGTVLPPSVTSFFRTFLFLAPYGIYAIVGATPQKLSDQLDGLFPKLSFSNASAGVVAINSVFVWCVLVTYTDPATNIARPVLLCFSRNAWFVASQGTPTWITSLVNLTTGAPELWATDGTTIYQCFAGTTAGYYDIQTKFYDLGAFTQRKQALRLALEILSPQPNLSLTATVTNELSQSSQIALQVQQVTLVFLGAGNAVLTFTGSGAQPIVWLLVSTSPEGYVNMSGDYLGFEFSGTSLPFTISGLALEVEPLGEWT